MVARSDLKSEAYTQAQPIKRRTQNRPKTVKVRTLRNCTMGSQLTFRNQHRDIAGELYAQLYYW